LKESLDHKRLSFDEYYLCMAFVASARGTCARRKVGAILVDKDYKFLSSGYNGNPSGAPHCIDYPCPGAKGKSGKDLDKCEAIHAEVNAIGQCHDVQAIHACFTTVSPCKFCVDSLLATPCKEIIFFEEYPHSQSKLRWEKAGRIWRQYNEISND
jgi:dCMP deaminase